MRAVAAVVVIVLSGCTERPDPRCADLHRQMVDAREKQAEIMAPPAPSDPQVVAWRLGEDLRLSSLIADLSRKSDAIGCP